MPLPAEIIYRYARNFIIHITRLLQLEAVMIKRLVTALILFTLSIALWAQETVALSSIDFSKAEISQSGPESFYLRNVALPDQTVSLSIVLNEEGAWEIDQIYAEADNYIPADVILDFATVDVTDEDNIEIDWVIYNGSILRGVLSLTGEKLSLSSMFSSRGTVETADTYPSALSDLLNSASPESDALAAQVTKLKEEMASLQTVKENLEAENESLQSTIDSLKSAVESAQADAAARDEAAGDTTVSASVSLVQSYIDKLDTLQAEIAALRTKVTALEEQLSAEMLSGRLTTRLANEVADQLSGDIDSAEASITQAITSTGRSGAGVTPDADNGRISELRSENEALLARMKRLDEEIRSTLLKSGFISMMRPALTEVLISGFATSEAQLGLWRVGNDSASQIDKSMLFGKLLLPVMQNEKPVLYSFKARSTDPADEWVGLGLHIFVENVEKRGYGLGDSLLVWLTRDQEVYKNNYTYLQLYRSDDDVNMDRVMDAVIQEPVTEFIAIEVLYEPVEQYITIAVDGEEKIRYKTWFGIDDGVEVALRSLGTAEFTDLRVTTMP